jgi:hypothetical protein
MPTQTIRKAPYESNHHKQKLPAVATGKDCLHLLLSDNDKRPSSRCSEKITWIYSQRDVLIHLWRQSGRRHTIYEEWEKSQQQTRSQPSNHGEGKLHD